MSDTPRADEPDTYAQEKAAEDAANRANYEDYTDEQLSKDRSVDKLPGEDGDNDEDL